MDLDIMLNTKFQKVAEAFKSRLQSVPEKGHIRKLLIKKSIGNFNMAQKLGKNSLSKITENGGVAGVDGSTNSFGDVFPYSITIISSLARSCNLQQKDLKLTDVFSPLLLTDKIVDEDEYRQYVKNSLAALEVNTALVALEEYNPKVLLMDGSLVRFKIEAPELWDKLRDMAIKKNTVLVGVVEGIFTNILCSALQDELNVNSAYDWELLFGLLNVGEALEMAPGLFKEGFRKCFIRSSFDPKPIGIDLLEEQHGFLRQVEDLIFTLTPQNGRGIPLWLDIIDKNVKISDTMIESLAKTYLGEEYVEFILAKRNRRSRF